MADAVAVSEGVFVKQRGNDEVSFGFNGGFNTAHCVISACSLINGTYTTDVGRSVYLIIDNSGQGSSAGSGQISSSVDRGGNIVLSIGALLNADDIYNIAVMVDGEFAGLIWGTSDGNMPSSVNPIFPIYARGDADNLLPSINGSSPNQWAGWQSALPAGGVVRMTGFNLPRTLTSYSGADQTTINAEGGDYGIEFTIPQNSDSVAIFDETFWLYIR